MISHNQLIACVIGRYGTGLYQAWVSLDRNNTICLGAHKDEANAMELINLFLESYQEGRINTLEDILAFIDSSCEKDLVESLPVIGPNIGEMVVKRSVYI
ncbi:MAG: hypothetical protein MOB07_24620 [Acidobacteria bacterium]|nr:hypothetical protein [Acidobacteriota bacterium]